jgi:hypothetical protein
MNKKEVIRTAKAFKKILKKRYSSNSMEIQLLGYSWKKIHRL